MNKIIDKAEVDASLKRAAKLAVSGTIEERSGQAGASVSNIAMRLRNELRIATMNWATVEAFNTEFEQFRDPLVALNAWQPALFTTRAVARDVIMTLMRVTDGPGTAGDLETLSRILGLFDGKTPSEIAESTGAREISVKAGLKFLQERVPLSWGKNQSMPSNPELVVARKALEPIRNSLVAHAKNYSSLDLRRDVPRTRAFLMLVSRLSDAVCMICNVPRDNQQEYWDTAYAEATRFWKIEATGASQK